MRKITTLLKTILIVLQTGFAMRSFARMIRTANGKRIERAPARPTSDTRLSVLVPVLNEEHRLDPCLAGLVAQGTAVSRILVIDGGSTDGTREVVCRWAAKDERITMVDATPVLGDINGKAHNLEAGFRHLHGDTDWVLTIDADARPGEGLVDALIAHAQVTGDVAFSVATRQELSGAGEGFVHPSMLATLVYRFGIPGHATSDPRMVQANGQCAMYRIDTLTDIGGFTGVMHDISEDVTLARLIAMRGHAVGFYESDDLVRVEMYSGWRDAWDNWTRSLPMRDRFTGASSAVSLLEATLVQALPSWLGPVGILSVRRSPLSLINIGLFIGRLGVLAGIARAYRIRPWTYWLSPFADPLVIARIWMMRARRSHTWRGRTLVAGDHA